MKKLIIILSFIIGCCILVILITSKSRKKGFNGNVKYSYNNINLNLIRDAKSFDDLFKLEKEIPLEGNLLGDIEKLKCLKDGEICILDAATKHVNIYDQNGKFIRLYGGYGKGPGEYIHANDFFVDDTLLYILDGSLMRIVIFSLDGTYKRTISLSEICLDQMTLANNKIFLYSSSKMLNEADGFCYDLVKGKKEFSFAEPNRFIKLLLSNGDVGLVMNNHSLEYSNNNLYIINPLQYAVREFSKDGEEVGMIFGSSHDFSPFDSTKKFDRSLPPITYLKSALNNLRIKNNLMFVSFENFENNISYLDFYTMDGEKINNKSIRYSDKFPPGSIFPLDIDNDTSFIGYRQPSFDSANNLPNPTLLKYKFLGYKK